MEIIVTLSEQIIAAVAALLAIGLISFSGFKYIKQQGFNEATAIYEKQKAADKKITDAATKKLQEQADNAAKDKQDAIQAADAKYAALLDSLRKRPTRPTQTGSSTTAKTTGSCTGAELYRDDAEFLAGQAALADKVVIERDFYYERYESARRLLSGEKSTSGLEGTVSNTESVSGDRVQP